MKELLSRLFVTVLLWCELQEGSDFLHSKQNHKLLKGLCFASSTAAEIDQTEKAQRAFTEYQKYLLIKAGKCKETDRKTPENMSCKPSKQ